MFEDTTKIIGIKFFFGEAEKKKEVDYKGVKLLKDTSLDLRGSDERKISCQHKFVNIFNN